MSKLSDFVVARLVEAGVKHLFLLPGGGCMHLVDSAGRNRSLELVCNLHEQACAIAAEAYGQYTDRLGAALVTTGPGGTNAITGVAAAWLDSTPCLFLSGQVKRADLLAGRGVRQMGFQEVDIVRLVTPITKYAVTVLEPSSIRYHLEKALHLARSGRPGPVWIDIPLDVQAARIDEAVVQGFDPREVDPPGDESALEAAVESALSLLAGARRPVILAGNGIRLAGAAELFLRTAEVLGIPVLTTWKALDLIPDDHPLYIGRPGAIGQRAANFAQQLSDWILVLGARLDLGQTAYNHANFAPRARKVMVDVDESEIRKMETPIDVPVHADAKRFLDALERRLGASPRRSWDGWVARCQELRARYPVVLPEHLAAGDGVSIYALVDALSEAMTAEDVFVPGSSGACSEVSMQAFRVKAGQRVFNSEGLGPMGFAVPAALGACLASGRRRTVSVDGDGGFHMNLQELEAIRRLELPIKLFVLDNGGYESIRATQRTHFGGHLVASSPESGLTLPDIGKLAEGYGVPSAHIASSVGLREAVRAVLARPGPVVCSVAVSPRQVTAPRVSSRQLPDGSMVSTPMEDLWPYLERAEYEACLRLGDSGTD